MVVFRLVQRRRLVVGLFPLVSGLLLALSPAGIVACTEVQDVGTTAPGAADATLTSDAGDASVTASDADIGDADATTTADDASTLNLVSNPSFEDDSDKGNCGTGWNVDVNANVIRVSSSIAHSGVASCEVCTQAPGVEAVLVNMRPWPDAGVTLVPAAWFRGVTGGALDGETVTAWIALNGCFPSCGPTSSPPVAPDASAWLLQDGNQQFFAEAGQGQTIFDYEIHVDGGCVLVDDVSVYAQ